jgi:hypothetical protein
MAEGKSEPLEIPLIKLRQDRRINAILCEEIRVLAETDVFEPPSQNDSPA